jgi:hypothetical protein
VDYFSEGARMRGEMNPALWREKGEFDFIKEFDQRKRNIDKI